MEENRDIAILRAFRLFLICLTVFKLDNFRYDEHFIRNIGRAIGLGVLLLIFLYPFLGSQFIVCFENKFNLNVVGQPLSLVCGSSQVLNVYFILFYKSDKIVELIRHIHLIVNERKFFALTIPRSTVLHT